MTNSEEIIHYRLRKAKEEIRNAELSYENQLYNSAVSAAYYGIFHSARALLGAESITTKKHSGVIHQFS